MTYRNYRVVCREGVYAIYEVYYREDGQIQAITQEAVEPSGESLEELQRDLEHFQEALSKPILDYEEVSAQLVGFGIPDGRGVPLEQVLEVPDLGMDAQGRGEFTAAASKRWNSIPEGTRGELLANAWCGRCGSVTMMTEYRGHIKAGDLVLTGKCARCGGSVVRLVEGH